MTETSAQAPAADAITVLERFYDAEREYMLAGGPTAGASFDGIGATLADDVVLHQSPDLPYGGDWAGFAGFRGWATAMSDLHDLVDVQDPIYFVSGDTVLVRCTLVTRARATGTRIEAPMIQEVRVQSGRIVEFRAFYWNVPAYVQACTPSPTADKAPA